MALAEAERKDIVRRISEEAFAEGSLDVIDEYFADAIVIHSAAVPEDFHGPEGYKEFIAATRAGFPDVDSTVEELIAEGEKVAERHVATGTHEGEFMGIEPTGKEIEAEGITILHFDEGEIVEAWDIADVMGMMQQLGVIEAPGE